MGVLEHAHRVLVKSMTISFDQPRSQCQLFCRSIFLRGIARPKIENWRQLEHGPVQISDPDFRSSDVPGHEVMQ